MEELKKYDFGMRLKRIRERRYSQSELGHKLGVTQSSIKRCDNTASLNNT